MDIKQPGGGNYVSDPYLLIYTDPPFRTGYLLNMRISNNHITTEGGPGLWASYYGGPPNFGDTLIVNVGKNGKIYASTSATIGDPYSG